jgi:hypothetical protein
MFHILASAADSKGNWTLQLDRAAPGTFVGKPFLVWRNVGWQPAILIANSSNVELDHLFYTGGGGPAVHVQESDGNIVIRNVDVDVPAGSQSLFAATSGFNGTSNRAKILIDHVIVKHTDDDAFHFSSGPYFPVLDQSDGDRKIRIDLCYPGQFRPGDELAALEWATKKIIGKAHVMTIEIVTDSNKLYRRTCDLSLDRALPQLENLRTYSEQNLGMQQDHNARITNLSLSSMLTVSNSYLSSMRARCGIVQVPAVIKDNICANTPMAGFLVGPEYAWGEGYAVNGLNISGNTFDTVGGTAIYIADIIDSINSPTEADIRSKRTSSDALRDNQNIQILDNRFCNLGAVSRGIMGIQGAAITVSNAQGVVIRGNTYGCNASPNVLPQSRIIISPYSTDAVAH